VIPTLNRESILLDTVRALLEKSSPCFLELLIIDQSDHPSLLATYKDDRLFYTRVDCKNLPRARNRGVSMARGEVVLFLDDDVAFVKDVVEAHALAHSRTRAWVVTGPILVEDGTFTTVSSLSSSQLAKLRSGDLLISNLDVEYSPLFAPGCNASYKRDILVALGGFDENFIGSAVGEDAEMCYRVKVNGGTILYDPAASLVHLKVPLGGCRDEADELMAGETSVLNAHYFAHRLGRPHLMLNWFLGILRTRVCNRRMLATVPTPVLARRALALFTAWWRARARTRALQRAGRGRVASALNDLT
jgi:GT2 family glycosyltransferase